MWVGDAKLVGGAPFISVSLAFFLFFFFFLTFRSRLVRGVDGALFSLAVISVSSPPCLHAQGEPLACDDHHETVVQNQTVDVIQVHPARMESRVKRG